ncbi:MAG: hypothetical protein NT058_00555, partial [Candidatus Portnoybacteria bacterium]|nr:hypothetical protein [Candidatus Portnoybacteria bacterium]
DFKRVKIDIETDGSVTPEQAFDRAAAILLEQFGVFSPVSTEVEITTGAGKEKKETKKVKKTVKKTKK